MLSSDKNLESVAQLVEALKRYALLLKDFAKYYIVEKVVRLLTVLVFAVVVFLLLLAVLLYLSFAAVYWMAPHIGLPCAFAAMAGFYFVVILLVAANKKRWIERPLVRILASILLEKKQ